MIVKYLFITKTTVSHLTIGTNSCEVPAIEQFENPVHTATRSDNPASGVGTHQSTKTQPSPRAWVGKPQGEPDVCQKSPCIGVEAKVLYVGTKFAKTPKTKRT